MLCCPRSPAWNPLSNWRSKDYSVGCSSSVIDHDQLFHLQILMWLKNAEVLGCPHLMLYILLDPSITRVVTPRLYWEVHIGSCYVFALSFSVWFTIPDFNIFCSHIDIEIPWLWQRRITFNILPFLPYPVVCLGKLTWNDFIFCCNFLLRDKTVDIWLYLWVYFLLG